jgi:hypothetical protein
LWFSLCAGLAWQNLIVFSKTKIPGFAKIIPQRWVRNKIGMNLWGGLPIPILPRNLIIAFKLCLQPLSSLIKQW